MASPEAVLSAMTDESVAEYAAESLEHGDPERPPVGAGSIDGALPLDEMDEASVTSDFGSSFVVLAAGVLTLNRARGRGVSPAARSTSTWSAPAKSKRRLAGIYGG